MARPGGNPDIAKHAVKFSSDREDQEEISRKGGEAKNSIRRAQRRLAAHKPGTDTPQLRDFARAFHPHGKLSELTVAQLMAIKSAQQATQNYKAMENFINNVDGKLIEKKAEVQMGSLVDIVAAADQIRDLEENGDGGDLSDDEEGGQPD